MNLFGIAVLGLIVMLQKLLPYGLVTTGFTGSVIALLGVGTFVVPIWLYDLRSPDLPMLPLAAGVISLLFVAVVAVFDAWGQQLAEANARERLLLRELQHRVANTLHQMLNTIEIAELRMETAPTEARTLLQGARRRISASAHVHRRLHDPSLFNRGLGSVLSDSVADIIDPSRLEFYIEDIGLSFDQMRVITMIVIEAANNAQKHVFDRNLGEHFNVALRRSIPDESAVLSIMDDGPEWSRHDAGERTRGLNIVQDLAELLQGRLHIEWDNGTIVSIVFPAPTSTSKGTLIG